MLSEHSSATIFMHPWAWTDIVALFHVNDPLLISAESMCLADRLIRLSMFDQ